MPVPALHLGSAAIEGAEGFPLSTTGRIIWALRDVILQ